MHVMRCIIQYFYNNAVKETKSVERKKNVKEWEINNSDKNNNNNVNVYIKNTML